MVKNTYTKIVNNEEIVHVTSIGFFVSVSKIRNSIHFYIVRKVAASMP